MDASEIRDEESLRAWLESLPDRIGDEEAQRWAVLIAHRAAMRVLPAYWQWQLAADKRNRDVTAIAVLRANLIGGVAGTCPTSPISQATDAAAYAAADAGADAAADAAFDAVYAAYAADAAARIAYAAADAAADAAYAAAAAAAAADAAYVAYAADAAALELGTDLNALRLWPGENPFESEWSEIRDTLSDQGPGWHFWLDWYDKALKGEAQDWDLLTKIALIDDADWDGGADHINALIADTVKNHETAQHMPETLAEAVVADRLIRAAIGDFSFDTLLQAMRLVPFADDIRFMRDPEALKRVQDDIGAVRDQMQVFAEAMAADRSTQGAGHIAAYINATLSEFDRAQATGELRVGSIIENGTILQHYALDDSTRAELGPLSFALQRHVDTLMEVTHRHFASTFLRFAPLREMTLEAGVDVHELLSDVRDGIRALKSAKSDAVTPLAAEDWAVFDAMADNIDRHLRAQFLAPDEKSKASYQRDINFHLAQLQVSLALYGIEGRQQAKTLAGIAGALGAYESGVTTLGRLWEMIRPLWGR